MSAAAHFLRTEYNRQQQQQQQRLRQHPPCYSSINEADGLAAALVADKRRKYAPTSFTDLLRRRNPPNAPDSPPGPGAARFASDRSQFALRKHVIRMHLR